MIRDLRTQKSSKSTNCLAIPNITEKKYAPLTEWIVSHKIHDRDDQHHKVIQHRSDVVVEGCECFTNISWCAAAVDENLESFVVEVQLTFPTQAGDCLR